MKAQLCTELLNVKHVSDVCLKASRDVHSPTRAVVFKLALIQLHGQIYTTLTQWIRSVQLYSIIKSVRFSSLDPKAVLERLLTLTQLNTVHVMHLLPVTLVGINQRTSLLLFTSSSVLLNIRFSVFVLMCFSCLVSLFIYFNSISWKSNINIKHLCIFFVWWINHTHFTTPNWMSLKCENKFWVEICKQNVDVLWKRRWRPETDTRQHTLTDTRAFCCARVRVCVTWGLEVQRNHLASSVPENLRYIITGVHSTSFGVDSTHLPFVVAAHLIQEAFRDFWRIFLDSFKLGSSLQQEFRAQWLCAVLTPQTHFKSEEISLMSH